MVRITNTLLLCSVYMLTAIYICERIFTTFLFIALNTMIMLGLLCRL